MPTEQKTPPRPKENDEAVIRWAARRLAESLEDEIPDANVEQMATDLEKALRYERYDGYKLARYLETYCYWEIDSHVVSCLDGWHVHDAHRQFQRDWVKAYDVRPLLSEGASVVYQGEAGTIARIDAAAGCYIVSVPSRGHQPTGGFVVPYEALESPPAVAAVDSQAAR